jgi:hypothetical protein
MPNETQVEKIMRLLECSEEEALDVIKHDEIIDKGGRTEHDFDKEKEKIAKKFANATTHKKPTVYKFDKRERKADIPKEELISQVAEFIKSIGCENVEITNKTKLIEFSVGGDNYKLDLIRKRK